MKAMDFGDFFLINLGNYFWFLSKLHRAPINMIANNKIIFLPLWNYSRSIPRAQFNFWAQRSKNGVQKIK